MAIKYEDKGQIKDGRLKCNHVDKLLKYLEENEGLYFSIVIKILGKAKCPKSRAQLGYIFGVLVPLITDELNAQGYTYTLNFKDLHREVEYDEGSTYELLKVLCANVGDNGKHITLSDPDMDLGRLSRFIENVLQLAVVNLGMNDEALRARKPK